MDVYDLLHRQPATGAEPGGYLGTHRNNGVRSDFHVAWAEDAVFHAVSQQLLQQFVISIAERDDVEAVLGFQRPDLCIDNEEFGFVSCMEMDVIGNCLLEA